MHGNVDVNRAMNYPRLPVHAPGHAAKLELQLREPGRIPGPKVPVCPFVDLHPRFPSDMLSNTYCTARKTTPRNLVRQEHWEYPCARNGQSFQPKRTNWSRWGRPGHRGSV